MLSYFMVYYFTTFIAIWTLYNWFLGTNIMEKQKAKLIYLFGFFFKNNRQTMNHFLHTPNEQLSELTQVGQKY